LLKRHTRTLSRRSQERCPREPDCVGGGLGSPRPLRTPKYLAPPFSRAGPSFCAARLVAPAVRSPGMTNGGSGDANTTNSGPTWAAAKANLREHAVRLRKRRGRYCLRGSCESYDKTSSSNQPNHFFLPSGHLCPFRRIVSPIC